MGYFDYPTPIALAEESTEDARTEREEIDSATDDEVFALIDQLGVS